jgi:hypothetical protein
MVVQMVCSSSQLLALNTKPTSVATSVTAKIATTTPYKARIEHAEVDGAVRKLHLQPRAAAKGLDGPL